MQLSRSWCGFWGCALLLWNGACTDESPVPGAGGNAAGWVIVNEKYSPALLDGCRPIAGPTAVRYWTPTAEQVRRADARLATAVDSALKARGHQLHAAEYTRQYAGLLRGDTEWLYVAGTHRELVRTVALESKRESRSENPESLDYWRRAGHSFCDVGMLAFSAKVDVSSGRVIELAFSGP